MIEYVDEIANLVMHVPFKELPEWRGKFVILSHDEKSL
jgi:hypothetical protein